MSRRPWTWKAIGGLLATVAATIAVGVPLVPATAVAGFGSPTVVTGADLGEPGIDIGADGAIYINAPAGLLSNLPGSASPVYKSTNGGTSFVLTPPGLRANLPGGGDSDIAIDPVNGKLYMTDLWLGSATVSVSSDGAQTWTANPLGGPPLEDRQWLAASGNAVYHVTHQIPTGLIVTKSIDGGITYPIASLAASPVDQTGCVCPPGNIVAEPGVGPLGTGDKVGVIYATSTGGVKFASSTNGGLTFTSSDVQAASNDTTSSNFPVVADAGGGNLVATWLAETGTASVVRFAKSSNFGATWSAPKTIVATGTSVYPWIAVRGAKVAVSLYNTAVASPTSGDPSLGGAQWFETYLESLDSGSTWSQPVSVDPLPVKTGPICTEGVNCSGNRELLDFQQLTIDAAGKANLTWTRSIDNVSDTELRFVKQT